MSSKKEYYTERALVVFRQDGLRLSLEEVAGKMGISKKTLYNHFASKEELQKECIRSISSNLREALGGLDDRNRSAIENLRTGFLRVNRFFTELSPVFFYDMMRLNPNQALLEHLAGSGLFQQKMEANLRQGIAQGLYRAELDAEVMGRYIIHSVFGFYINSLVNHHLFLPKSYFADMVEYNLRALVSEKGKQQL